jgi:hypothetical protein
MLRATFEPQPKSHSRTLNLWVPEFEGNFVANHRCIPKVNCLIWGRIAPLAVALPSMQGLGRIFGHELADYMRCLLCGNHGGV